MPDDLDRDEMARDLIGCFPVLDKSDRSAADAWPGPTAAADAIAELADARHELDVLRGIVADLEQRLDLALGDLTQALAERDEARRNAASWEEWGQGWKGQAEGSRTARDKAWAELDQVRAELAKTVSNFEEFAESVADRRRPTEAAPGALDLDVLKALADAATPGPWTATANRSVDDANGEHVVASVAARKLWPSTADAEFIAAAREAVPRLIAEVANATEQGAGWMDEARRQAAERDREFQRAEQAEAERDQLRYERRLLGFARHVLDRAATATSAVEREQVEREAADVAQRIVDELGHPVTDEPALGPRYREQIAALTAERDRRGDDLRRAQGQALDRATVKPRVHQALHDLNVRIVGLDKGDCHCNLIAEVVLDALDHGEAGRDG